MVTPDLSWLRQILAPDLAAATAVPLKQSSTPATVYRLRLAFNDGRQASAILKRMAPGWPDDPQGHLREARFYACLLPCLDMPQVPVYYAGPDPDGDHQAVLLADVSPRYRLPSPRYAWSPEDAPAMVGAYAHLHSSGYRCLPAEREWLVPRHETRVRQMANRLPDMVADIAAVAPGWPDGAAARRLLVWLWPQMAVMEQEASTLLHNDVYPPNVALPRRAGDPALLFDWEMVGWGIPEMDLAFMFLQPYGSHRHLDRQAVLDRYWAARATLPAPCPPAAARPARQQYADVLWAMWLVPVAWQMVRHPFPAGAAPRRYWDSMLPVLGRRLRQLGQAT